MEEVVKLLLPFLSTPKDYAQVLKKLASFAFYETYLITLLLRANPRFDTFFAGIESWGPIGKVAGIVPHHEVLNLFGVVIAFAVAVLTHMFQFHDRISDIFGIRRRFDCKSILIPLSQRVGSVVTEDKEVKIGKHRDELMRTVFYKYASSRADMPLVDKHDIEHALNAWSWFWAFVEAVVYFGVGAIIAWWVGSHGLAGIFAITSAAVLIIAFVQRTRLGRYARPQIDSIAANPTAAADVKCQFDAL
ncbi:MAG TPA: hypothetical protein VMT51_01365 [Dongiaceae bacterium]|jgi:hypothetical protein|nr:hypothetical protein [Dongiaceae bacterium]